MKNILTIAVAICISIFNVKGQTPKIYFNCNNTLQSQAGGLTLTNKFGTSQWSSTPQPGNGTHALKFTGNNLLVSPLRMDTVKSMTVSCWINIVPGVEGNYQTVFGQWNTVHPLWQQPSVVNTFGTFRITVQTISGAVYPRFWMFLSGVEAIPFYPTNDSLSRGWHHLVYTWQSKKDGFNDWFNCYIDGKLIKENWITTDKTFDYTSAGQDFYVGGFYDVKNNQTGQPTFSHQQPFTGELDEIKIYGEALDSNQVKILFNNSSSNYREMSKSNIILSPNPAINELFISNNTLKQDIFIYNNQGQMFLEHKSNLDNATIDVSHFSNGLYFVKIGASTAKFMKI